MPASQLKIPQNSLVRWNIGTHKIIFVLQLLKIFKYMWQYSVLEIEWQLKMTRNKHLNLQKGMLNTIWKKDLWISGNKSALAASNWIFDQAERDLDTPLEDELEMIRARQAERERGEMLRLLRCCFESRVSSCNSWHLKTLKLLELYSKWNKKSGKTLQK